MKKRMPKRYRFVSPTISNSIPTWEEDPNGKWIKDCDFVIDVSKYQKSQNNKSFKRTAKNAAA